MPLAQQAEVDKILAEVKKQLGGQLLSAFHRIDTDNSGSISTSEFTAKVKEFGIVLPPRVMHALIDRFDANGDGFISIPEFTAFMSGDAHAQDALAMMSPVTESQPSLPVPGRSMSQASARAMQMASAAATADLFVSRMESDIDARRRTAFICELQKDPRFKPSMLEPPKPKFREVTLTGGPVIKSHDHNKTGLETRKPYKWGPLGGYY